jgi:hypothetical protein
VTCEAWPRGDVGPSHVMMWCNDFGDIGVSSLWRRGDVGRGLMVILGVVSW